MINQEVSVPHISDPETTLIGIFLKSSEMQRFMEPKNNKQTLSGYNDSECSTGL